jgi:hypothetical protein
VNRNKFPDCIIIPNRQAAGRLIEIQYLRRTADDTIGEQLIVFAKFDVFANNNMGVNDCPVSNFRAGINQGKWSNGHVIA